MIFFINVLQLPILKESDYMFSHSTASPAQTYDLSKSKAALKEQLDQLDHLHGRSVQQDASNLTKYGSRLTDLITALNDMHTYIEELDTHQNNIKDSEFYKFQNQLHKDDVVDSLQRLYKFFYESKDVFAAVSASNKFFNVMDSFFENYDNTKKYLSDLIDSILQKRKVDELALFQEMERDAILKIKDRLLKEHTLDNLSNEMIKDLRAIPNLKPWHEYSRKKTILLYAALLKEGVDYVKVYRFGIANLPGAVGYSDAISDEEMKRHQKEHEYRKQVVSTMKHYLCYFPLIAYGLCTFKDLQQTIDTLKENNQFTNVLNRFELYNVLGGDIICSFNKFYKLKKMHGHSDCEELDEAADSKWITAWRDKEIALLLEQTKEYSALHQQLTSLKKTPIAVDYRGAAVIVTGIGPIGDILLALNDYEMKKIALSKKPAYNVSFFTPANNDQEDKNSASSHEIQRKFLPH